VLELAGDLAGEVVQAALYLGQAHAQQGDHAAAREAYETGHRLAERTGDPELIEFTRNALR
jgi:hypothetical protein